MADIFYGIDRGETLTDVATDSSSPTKDVEVVVDDAVNLTKTEIIQALEYIKEFILQGNDI